MRNILIAFLTFLSVLFFACNDKKGNYSKQTPEFEFILEGNAKSGNGKVISLCIPSKGLDQRLISTIENGKYRFMGKANYIENAIIRFEENIVNNSHMYWTTTVFIEPGITQIDFTVAGDSMRRYLDSIIILKGSNNIYFYNTKPSFYDAYSFWVFADQERIDSMQQFVYPGVRENILRSYDSLYAENDYPAISLYFLKVITHGFERNGPFRKDQLNDREMEKLINYFSKTDTSLAEYPNYSIVQSSIEKLKDINQKIHFTDYEFVDINGQLIRLSDVIKKNNVTVLDFWWSGCIPCRKFNRRTSVVYDSLHRYGIEIIGINVDESKIRWEESSLKDSIQWINLYAGATSDIPVKYGVAAYPTKLTFDKNHNLIDFEFKEAIELLKLVKD